LGSIFHWHTRSFFIYFIKRGTGQ